MSTPRQQFAKRLLSEGVAAPLEPLDIETFKLNGATSREWAYLHRTRRDGTSGNLGKLLRDFAEAYAAAVSKNLQQSVEQLCGDLKAIQQDYTNEKKRAENLREELAEINRVIMERFGELKCSTKDDEGNQLDASDLVCILATRLELSRQNFAKAETRISGLEKEIAALRETKP